MSAQIAGMGVGAAAALLLKSPVALAIGQSTGAVLTLGVASLAVRRQLSLSVARGELRYLVGFSTQVSGQNLVFFAIYTLPSWLVSRTFGSVALGLLSRANLLVTLPTTHLTVGATKALYPLYPRVMHDSRRAARLLSDALAASTRFAWPLLAAAAAASP